MNLVINKRNICVVLFQVLFLIIVFSVAKEAYAATASIFTPNCTSDSCPFTFLAPIDFFSKEGVSDVAQDGATMYLKGLYKFGIAIAAALAVLMITLGGVQYSTTDAIGGKSEGKEKIKSALTGLLLALLSYTILNTINPYLVAGDFDPPLISVSGGIGSNTGSPAVTPVTNQTTNPIPNTTVDGTAAQKLDASAKAMMGKDTCYVPNTGSGRRACAYVVNAIVDEALGSPIQGNPGDANSYGRTTAEMYRNLSSSQRFTNVGSDVSKLQPGDIIISPTQGSNTGHVGIYSSNGKIISNSSSSTEVDDKFTPDSWVRYYQGKGLSVSIFRASKI